MENLYHNFHEYLIRKANVKESHFQEFRELISVKNYSKGEIILSQGSICNHIFFVEKGLLRFYSIGENGKEHILQFAPENWWLTDRNNLCSDEPSQYFIDAYEASTVLLLGHDFIIKASEISKEFSAFHEHILQRHILSLYKRINMLIGTPAKESYLDFIHTYPDITQRVPQWMIASYLGITPEFLSRIRKELTQA